MNTIDIIVSGHLCLDLLPRMAHVPLAALSSPGRLFEVGALDYATGGSVSNTGLALRQLGLNVRLMALVGEDLIGQAVISLLRARDAALTEQIIAQPGYPTSYTIVLAPERVDRIFLHCTGTNDVFGAANVDFALLPQARLFHLGYPPLLPQLYAEDGTQLETIYRQAYATGVITSLDMALPDPDGPSGQADWVRIFERTLPYLDIFLPSIEEIIYALRKPDFLAWRGNLKSFLTAQYLSHLADEILAGGAAVVGFKLGELGLYLKTGRRDRLERLRRLGIAPDEWADREIYAPAFEVEVVGTTGAGDSAYAGFLAAALRGLSPEEAVRWSCAVGACNVEAADATSGVRTWEATSARLAAGWNTRTERLAGA